MMHSSSRRLPILPAAMILAFAGAAALAQVVIPAPPAPAKTPEFTPPPPPPPPSAQPQPSPGQPGANQPQPSQPVQPAIAVPDLVKRDAKGDIAIYPEPNDEVGIAALGIAADAQGKADAVRSERKSLFDRHLTRNYRQLMEIRDLVRRMKGSPEPIKETRVQDLIPARAIAMQPLMRDNLVGAGVFSQPQSDAIRKSVDAYTAALIKEQEAKAKDGKYDHIAVTSWINLSRMTIEPMREAERLLGQFAGKWPALKAEATAGASADALAAITKAEAALSAAKTPGTIADAAEQLLKAVGDDKAPALLEKAWLPLPSNRLIPDMPVRSGPPTAPRNPANPGAAGGPPPVQATPVEPRK